MYFKDGRGVAVLSSRDGVSFDMTDAVASDVVKAVSVPGKSRAQLGEIPWTGTSKEYKGRSDETQKRVVQMQMDILHFSATFEGIFKDSTRLIMWSSCCA